MPSCIPSIMFTIGSTDYSSSTHDFKLTCYSSRRLRQGDFYRQGRAGSCRFIPNPRSKHLLPARNKRRLFQLPHATSSPAAQSSRGCRLRALPRPAPPLILTRRIGLLVSLLLPQRALCRLSSLASLRTLECSCHSSCCDLSPVHPYRHAVLSCPGHHEEFPCQKKNL